MNPAKYALAVEYNGTRYHGFQWQAGLPTIQAELERAIGTLCGQTSRVMAASRTDSGVHAKDQVVSFWAKPALATMTLVKALNYYLPGDIAVKAAYNASDEFNVRRDALSREYCYYMLNRSARSPFSEMFALFMPKMLDVEIMSQACQLLRGQHDFMSFVTSSGNVGSATRHVYEADISRKGDFVVFRIVANSFLRHQVRNTVGLLVRLGLGKIGITDFCDIMEAKQPGLAGPTVPAKGLWLTKVNYAEPVGGRE